MRWVIIISLFFAVSATIGSDAKGCWGQKMTDRTDITWQVGSSYRPPSGGGGSGGSTPPPSGPATGWTVTVNPTTSDDTPYAVAIDTNYIYIAGGISGDGQWRIEKRNISDGSLETNFGAAGIVTVNPGVALDAPYEMCVDASYIYIIGYDSAGATGSYGWRLEKRDISSGALDTGFGTSGVVQFDPTIFNEYGYTITQDSTYLYIAGNDYSPGGGAQWWIEKRLKTTGALDTGFGTGGGVGSGVMANLTDLVREMVTDGTNLYICGYNGTSWRIEKRLNSTGALVGGFGTGGIVTNAIGISCGIAEDGSYIYVVGTDGTTAQWRVEKRSITSGALDTAFGTSGVLIYGPGAWARDVFEDGSYIYIVGDDTSGSQGRWRVEKREKATGALDSTFGTSGTLIVESNPTATQTSPFDITGDSTYLYIVGDDLNSGNGQWRIEKMLMSTGGQ